MATAQTRETSEGIERALLTAQRRVLEAYASGAPTSEILEMICLLVEETFGGGKRCVSLLVKNGEMRLGAAPSLPPNYAEAVKRIPIGPQGGSCGTAVYRAERVIDPDVTTSGLWGASPGPKMFQIEAAWSIPVFGRGDEGVLGTFAVYAPRGETPDDEHLQLLEGIAEVVGLVLSRDRVEIQLGRERRRLSQALDGTQIGLWEWTIGEERVWVSDELKNLLEFDFEGDYAPMHFEQRANEDDLAIGSEKMRQHLEGKLDFFEFELRFRLDDGSWRWMLDRGRVVERDDAGKAVRVLGTMQDITELKHAQSELQRMQKLEGLGRLAGGVAHDFNNILVGIFGGIALAKEQLNPEDPAYLDLQIAEESLERARGLTRQLLTFSKGGEPVRTVLDLGPLIDEVVRFDLSGSSLKPIVDIPDDLWRADVDKGQIQQVFANLAINSRQAAGSSGHFWVTLRNVEVVEPDVVAPGNWIRAEVRDDGSGIPEDVLERIFEPYFSTKASGSGLGLATVYSIVNRHGGTVQVESEPGVGTTFVVWLPATLDAETLSEVSASEADPGLLRILVLDDDDQVLQVASRMLAKLGHSIVTTKTGREVVEHFRRGYRCDVALLDITIPGEDGGKEIVGELRRMDPDVILVASTGYADDSVTANYARFGFDDVLPKPYSLEELRDAIVRSTATRRRSSRRPRA